MKIELFAAVISGAVAIGSAALAYQSKIKVQELHSALALSLAERKPYFEQRKMGYEQLFGSTAMFNRLGATLAKIKEVEKYDRACADLNDLRTRADKEEDEAQWLWRNGLFRIGVYSDAAVVSATSRYLLNHKIKCSCIDTKKYTDDVNIYKTIRNELGSPGGEVNKKDLAAVLFSCELGGTKPPCRASINNR